MDIFNRIYRRERNDELDDVEGMPTGIFCDVRGNGYPTALAATPNNSMPQRSPANNNVRPGLPQRMFNPANQNRPGTPRPPASPIKPGYGLPARNITRPNYSIPGRLTPLTYGLELMNEAFEALENYYPNSFYLNGWVKGFSCFGGWGSADWFNRLHPWLSLGLAGTDQREWGAGNLCAPAYVTAPPNFAVGQPPAPGSVDMVWAVHTFSTLAQQWYGRNYEVFYWPPGDPNVGQAPQFVPGRVQLPNEVEAPLPGQSEYPNSQPTRSPSSPPRPSWGLIPYRVPDPFYWSTNGPGTTPIPVRNPLPTRPGRPERKIRGPLSVAAAAAAGIFHTLTEVGDAVDSLADAIPGKPCDGMGLAGKTACVLANAESIDWFQAVGNLWENYIEDAAIGAIHQQLQTVGIGVGASGQPYRIQRF